MYRMTVKAWASILLCALFFAAAAAKPAYASESGDAVQQIPAAQETSAEQQSAEPDPSIPLRITAIDFGWEGWGDGTMIESKGECMLMDTFMPDCGGYSQGVPAGQRVHGVFPLPLSFSRGSFREYEKYHVG